MSEVVSHAEEEERTLLPHAERVLEGKLHKLGAQMNRRRLELAKPVAGKLAWNAAHAMPMASVMLGAAVLLAGGFFLNVALKR